MIEEDEPLQNASPRDPTIATRRLGWAVLIAAIALMAVVAVAIAMFSPVKLARTGPPSVDATVTSPEGASAPTRAATSQTAAPPPAAPVWTVDKAASRLTFRASLGGQPVDGVFRNWDAQIAFDPKNLKASHAMIVVETSSALTGEPNRDELLPTPNWLSTRRYPKATLVTRSITESAPGLYRAVSDLKVRGVTVKMTAPFTLTIAHDVARMQCVIDVDRHAFAVGEVPGMPLAALAPDVQVRLRLVARKDH